MNMPGPYLQAWAKVRRLARKKRISDADLREQAIAALYAGQVFYHACEPIIRAPDVHGLALRVFLIAGSYRATIETEEGSSPMPLWRRIGRDLDISTQRVAEAMASLIPALRAAGIEVDDESCATTWTGHRRPQVGPSRAD